MAFVVYHYPYLSTRSQSVYLRLKYSDFEISKYSVPQGTVLGPLLFIIYVNDFFEYISPVTSHMIADDISIQRHGYIAGSLLSYS